VPVPTQNSRVRFGKAEFFESVKRPLSTDFPVNGLTTQKPMDWKINSNRNAATGKQARPSSPHWGGVNAIMCDAHRTFLSNAIDPRVYVKLITPDGVNFGEGDLPRQGW
jgi:hypothetical protein